MDRRSHVTKQKRAYRSEVADALNRRIELHTCRQHHTILRHMLSEFPTCEPFSGAQIMELRQRLNVILDRHLRLEDEQLYPRLSHATDEHVRATALEFRVEMGGVMRAFADLNARWIDAASIDAEPTAFLEQWTSVRAALEARMDAEDQALYPQAEQHFTEILKRSEAG